jgi:uncharacterized protein (TIGR00299 family) protein
MRVLYLDCFAGISGDMIVGALADLGVSPSTFEWELSQLELGDYHLHFGRQIRQGIAGVKFDVHAGATHVEADSRPQDGPEAGLHSHGHEHKTAHPTTGARSYADIRHLIGTSELSHQVKQRALAVFRRLAEVEAKIHGVSVEEVQFHEIGALDSIVDIVLACVGFESLKIERIYFSDLHDGNGTIRSAHGIYPVPAPATLELLRGIPLRQIDLPFELITPTGAAIVAEFQHATGPMPALIPERVGYGIGSRQLPDRPNILRAILGDLVSEPVPDSIVEIQTNLDDVSPEIIGATQDKLFAAGAAEVFLVPVQMKKGRPGMLLTVLCAPDIKARIEELLFRETSTFGIRYRTLERSTLHREYVEVVTALGTVTVKIGSRNGQIMQIAPEFESCQTIAERSGLPLKSVYQIALEGYRQMALEGYRSKNS